MPIYSLTGCYYSQSITFLNLIRVYYLHGKGGYVFGSVGLSVCGYHYSKSYERIGMKFCGGVPGSIKKN